MARIRTIKPEFPQSESMGRVSRDARLLFIMIWTICDDVGRARGNSRILASLLFPYDLDAGEKIDIWISELENEGCIERYIIDGSTYLQCCNWLKHQKIDKPSASRIPEIIESSRILANPRESSSPDLGPRTLDLDLGSRTVDHKTLCASDDAKVVKPSKRFNPPTFGEVSDYCQERNNGIDPSSFVDFYEARGWLLNKNKMKDWKAAVRTWESRRKDGNGDSHQAKPSYWDSARIT